MSIQEKSSPNICPALRNMITPKLKSRPGLCMYDCFSNNTAQNYLSTPSHLPFPRKIVTFCSYTLRNTPFSPPHPLTDTKQLISFSHSPLCFSGGNKGLDITVQSLTFAKLNQAGELALQPQAHQLLRSRDTNTI